MHHRRAGAHISVDRFARNGVYGIAAQPAFFRGQLDSLAKDFRCHLLSQGFIDKEGQRARVLADRRALPARQRNIVQDCL